MPFRAGGAPKAGNPLRGGALRAGCPARASRQAPDPGARVRGAGGGRGIRDLVRHPPRPAAAAAGLARLRGQTERANDCVRAPRASSVRGAPREPLPGRRSVYAALAVSELSGAEPRALEEGIRLAARLALL